MKLLFDAFGEEELSQKWAIAQIADFEYKYCFIFPIGSLNVDFFGNITVGGFLTPDEAHLLYIVDQDLRMAGSFEPKFPHIIELQEEEEQVEDVG